MSQQPDAAARLNEMVARLLRETERLVRDVRVVGDRIEPQGIHFDQITSRGSEPPKTMGKLFESINMARRNIVDAERHLNVIRSHIVSIADDVYSREELKKHMTTPSPTVRKR